jgi:hypothetical protein
MVGCSAFRPMPVSQCQPPVCLRHVAVCKDSVRREFASRGRFSGLCGQTSIPCADFPIRAGVFWSVRSFFNPCGESPVSCGPTSRPCADFPICAAVFRSGRTKCRVFDVFFKNPKGIQVGRAPGAPGRDADGEFFLDKIFGGRKVKFVKPARSRKATNDNSPQFQLRVPRIK